MTRDAPGPDYRAWLEWLHRTIRPASYLEIGVDKGATLMLARPPTVAIGVDPRLGAGPIALQLTVETHLYAETSDDFFASGRLRALLSDRPLELAFVDGLHTFEQALRDFVNVEARCGPRSVAVIHDTLPPDEASQSRERRSVLWTGDVWKAIVCLREYRPELDLLTLPAAPAGLTIVLGLDPSSSALADALDEAIRRFSPLRFAETRLDTAVNVVANDFAVVHDRLVAAGILDA